MRSCEVLGATSKRVNCSQLRMGEIVELASALRHASFLARQRRQPVHARRSVVSRSEPSTTPISTRRSPASVHRDGSYTKNKQEHPVLDHRRSISTYAQPPLRPPRRVYCRRPLQLAAARTVKRGVAPQNDPSS